MFQVIFFCFCGFSSPSQVQIPLFHMTNCDDNQNVITTLVLITFSTFFVSSPIMTFVPDASRNVIAGIPGGLSREEKEGGIFWLVYAFSEYVG